jgi:hypothetical protein
MTHDSPAMPPAAPPAALPAAAEPPEEVLMRTTPEIGADSQAAFRVPSAAEALLAEPPRTLLLTPPRRSVPASAPSISSIHKRAISARFAQSKTKPQLLLPDLLSDPLTLMPSCRGVSITWRARYARLFGQAIRVTPRHKADLHMWQPTGVSEACSCRPHDA